MWIATWAVKTLNGVTEEAIKKLQNKDPTGVIKWGSSILHNILEEISPSLNIKRQRLITYTILWANTKQSLGNFCGSS